MAIMNLRETALQLASAGYRPVPLFPGRKHLDLAAMGHEPWHLNPRSKHMKEVLFEGTLVSLAQLPHNTGETDRWFGNSHANIGIVTGCSNLTVLDFDHAAAFDWFSRSNPGLVRKTPLARSQSGWHVYLRSPHVLVTSSLYRRFSRIGHLKALGGYVVCPPSVLANGTAYDWQRGQSLLEMEPQMLPDLASLGISQKSPLKAAYDNLLGRGGFEDR